MVSCAIIVQEAANPIAYKRAALMKQRCRGLCEGMAAATHFPKIHAFATERAGNGS